MQALTADSEPRSSETATRPRSRASVYSHALGGELILVDTESGGIHALNPTAAVVWQCLDGGSLLEEIATDLAEGFGAPVELVRHDVTSITTRLGEAGLLEGVERRPEDDAGDGPMGMPRGEPVRLGRPAIAEEPRQRVLVNWSSTCGFCLGILPEIASLQPFLQRAETDLVLIDGGDAETTRRQLDEHRVVAEILAPERSPFAGLGTPAAYLLDEQSRAASQLAYGADEVIRLLRSTVADISDIGEELPRFLPVGGGVCGPTAVAGVARGWQPISGYQVGSYRVGIRANTVAGSELVEAAFTSCLLPDGTPAPCNFSVILPEPSRRGRRELNLLLAGSNVVARSRSPLRVLEVLAAHLNGLFDPPEGIVRLDAAGAVMDGVAVLIPRVALSPLDRVQGPLARLGLSLVDGPFAHVDPIKGELVVPEARIRVEERAVKELHGRPAGTSEPRAVPSGCYPLRSWLFAADGELSPAGAVARALGAVVTSPSRLGGLIDPIADLLSSLRVVSVSLGSPEGVIEQITATCRG